MEFQQLEMFVAIVQEGSMRRASERVFRTGPAVSIAIRKLEEEAGSPLFNRSDRHHFQLTTAGSLLYSYATRILNLRVEAVSGLRDLAACRTGIVKIGANESTSLYLLPKLTHAFQEAHPGVKIEATCDNSEAILTALKDCDLDLALVAHTTDDDFLKRYRVMHDEVVLITHPQHRLTTLPGVLTKDLRDEVIIAEGSKSSLHEEVAEAFRHSGEEFNASVTNVSIEAIKRMVAEGVGVGFVPSVCIHEENVRGELAVIKVEGVTRQRELWLVHRNDDSLSPAAHAFVKVSLRLARSWAKQAVKAENTSSNDNKTANDSHEQLFRPARSYC